MNVPTFFHAAPGPIVSAPLHAQAPRDDGFFNLVLGLALTKEDKPDLVAFLRAL